MKNIVRVDQVTLQLPFALQLRDRREKRVFFLKKGFDVAFRYHNIADHANTRYLLHSRPNEPKS
jgi:hypothetical protein